MKALVTGAAGFIGSHLSEHLIAAGHEVTGIDVFTDYYPRVRKESNLAALRRNSRFTLVETALADADWPRLLDGVTRVFHLAAQAGVRKSWGRDFHVYTVNNVDGTQVLLDYGAPTWPNGYDMAPWALYDDMEREGLLRRTESV